ncbi:ParB N-terminal domain-containing protein [Brucella sp. HL-2]|nr:plasmid partitioning protein RepB C-terminal domain-containing protein [Brucella sp. HL-2]MCV9910384.1 ParB N-terminal domain-containing protein [Brucella sp. HL-2]
MNTETQNSTWRYIDTIPIDRIVILNPRVRDKRKFRNLVTSISRVGLKRPITVAKKTGSDGAVTYDLVCGQGRVEAFNELEQSLIPAMVIDASQNDCLVMSLVENFARRQHRAIDLLREVGNLRSRGYSDHEIAKKIGVSPEYVNMIASLLERGEERLLSAVEAGTLPLSLAMEIAKSDEDGAQAAMMEAYAQNKLRGKKLLAVRRILEMRSKRGGGLPDQAFGRYDGPRRPLTSEAMVRTYQQEAERQKVLIKKAEVTQGKLMFVTEALKSLMTEQAFLNLLQTEGLNALPAQLHQRLVRTSS